MATHALVLLLGRLLLGLRCRWGLPNTFGGPFVLRERLKREHLLVNLIADHNLVPLGIGLSVQQINMIVFAADSSKNSVLFPVEIANDSPYLFCSGLIELNAPLNLFPGFAN
jgi:hypothetical protein